MRSICEESPDGAKLYGHVPHVGPKAWFHVTHPGLDPTALVALPEAIGTDPPTVLVDLLRWSNGLHLFSGALSLYGRRLNFDRSSDVRQPFDLTDANVSERPRGLAREAVIVAFYKADGSYAYLEARGLVRRAARGSHHVLNEWNDLGGYLASEVSRLSEHFDGMGRRRVQGRSTAPDPSE